MNKRNSKRLFSSLVMLLLSLGMQAQVMEPCVVVELADGNKSEFLLSTLPSITFVGNLVQLTASDTQVLYDADIVQKVYLSESVNNGTRITAPQSSRFEVAAGAIKASGLTPGSMMTAYTADGKLIASQKVDESGAASLSISLSHKGVIIIKTKNQSFKYIRK